MLSVFLHYTSLHVIQVLNNSKFEILQTFYNSQSISMLKDKSNFLDRVSNFTNYQIKLENYKEEKRY